MRSRKAGTGNGRLRLAQGSFILAVHFTANVEVADGCLQPVARLTSRTRWVAKRKHESSNRFVKRI